MSNVSQWDNAAVNNNDTPPDGWPEGQAPSTVNDCAREMQAAISRWYDDQKGELVTAGSSNAYTLTTNSTHAALADQSLLVFRADRANTGAATLNVDSLGAKSMRINGTALASGNLVADVLYAAVYNATDDAYDLQCGLTASMVNTALGLGSMSTQAASSVAITGGSITGITDLAIADGGTGASTVSDARSNLLLPVTKYKTVFTSRTNTITQTDDPHIAGFSLTADTSYEVEGMFEVEFGSTSNGGLKISLDFSNTPQSTDIATGIVWETHIGGTINLFNGVAIGGTHTVTSSALWALVKCKGIFTANASTGGDVSLTWAQNTSNAQFTKLTEGGYLSIREL